MYRESFSDIIFYIFVKEKKKLTNVYMKKYSCTVQMIKDTNAS